MTFVTLGTFVTASGTFVTLTGCWRGTGSSFGNSWGSPRRCVPPHSLHLERPSFGILVSLRVATGPHSLEQLGNVGTGQVSHPLTGRFQG